MDEVRTGAAKTGAAKTGVAKMGAAGMDRRAAVAALLRDRGDLLVVTGLGSATYDVAAAGDHPGNFYLWGAMGGAAMLGLGLAAAQPGRPVLVLTGDAELMMGMGALATVAVQAPPNLVVAVLDNGHFGETGSQVSHSGRGVAIDRVAAACGFPWSEVVHDLAGVEDLRARLPRRDGLKLAVLRIAADNPARVLPPRDGAFVKARFRGALGLHPG